MLFIEESMKKMFVKSIYPLSFLSSSKSVGYAFPLTIDYDVEPYYVDKN